MKRSLGAMLFGLCLLVASASFVSAQTLTSCQGTITNVGYGVGGVPLVVVTLSTPNKNTYTFTIPMNQTYTNGMLAVALTAASTKQQVIFKTNSVVNGAAMANLQMLNQ